MSVGGLECAMCGRIGHLAKDCSWGATYVQFLHSEIDSRELTGEGAVWRQPTADELKELMVGGEIGVLDAGFRFIESPALTNGVVLKGRPVGMSTMTPKRRNPLKLSTLAVTLRGVFPSLPARI